MGAQQVGAHAEQVVWDMLAVCSLVCVSSLSGAFWRCEASWHVGATSQCKKTKMFIKVQGDVSEPNHLRCAKELTAPTDPRQCAWGLN